MKTVCRCHEVGTPRLGHSGHAATPNDALPSGASWRRYDALGAEPRVGACSMGTMASSFMEGFRMSENHQILGVHLIDRIAKAGEVQRLFTEFGCDIKTRVGMHDARGDVCGPGGIIILECVGSAESFEQLAAQLKAIEGVEVQQMVFNHVG
jgi:hypothetical protein